MKKVIGLILASSLLLAPMLALGQVNINIGDGPPDIAPTLEVLTVLDRITNWLFALLLVVAGIFIILAGYQFVTAQGDPEKTQKARMWVLYALIGVLVGFVAKGLVLLVGTIVGG